MQRLVALQAREGAPQLGDLRGLPLGPAVAGGGRRPQARDLRPQRLRLRALHLRTRRACWQSARENYLQGCVESENDGECVHTCLSRSCEENEMEGSEREDGLVRERSERSERSEDGLTLCFVCKLT